MKKWIFLLSLYLLLTGCAAGVEETEPVATEIATVPQTEAPTETRWLPEITEP